VRDMGLFKRKKEEKRENTAVDEEALSGQLLKALIGSDKIDRETAMNIPAISGCVNMIGDTVASLQIKLYRRTGEKIEEVANDRRTYLLNQETGDTLDAVQFKKAMVTDMYLSRGGYAYVNKVGSKVKSIHYVKSEEIGFSYNTDPIWKDYQIIISGKTYEGWMFIKLFRNTRNGYYGRSIIEESPELFNIIYSSQMFEKNMVKTGGNKKGFIQSTIRLTREAMENLKAAFRNLYSNNTENVVILNDGLSFKESSNNSVELQLNENKETNSNDVCKIFNIPPSIINGGATEEDKKLFYEGCIQPVLVRFETAINSVMLAEDEKDSMFFAFDDADLTKSDIEKRFNAYKTALDSGFMQVDEVRKNEKLPAFGLDFIKLGLQDVLYYPKSGKIYTPNTDKLSGAGSSTKSGTGSSLETGKGQEESIKGAGEEPGKEGDGADED
jgi:HK97 family phage portal protein